MTALWERAAPLLSCPTCHAPFALDGRRLLCGAGHSVDLARQGHANLLGRAAPAHADTAAMVAARDRFLTAGHYQPLSKSLAAVVPSDASVLVEVGAGTAHHLTVVLDQLPEGLGIATDVSPLAARRAARAHPRAVSVVADTWQRIPVLDGVVDAVLCVFAPRQAAEFARLLRPGGIAVLATPTAEHLRELRDTLGLLGIHDDKDRQLEEQFRAFTLVERVRVEHELVLDAESVADLVGMGPNAFHGARADSHGATAHVSVDVRVLRR